MHQPYAEDQIDPAFWRKEITAPVRADAYDEFRVKASRRCSKLASSRLFEKERKAHHRPHRPPVSTFDFVTRIEQRFFNLNLWVCFVF